VGCIFTLRNAPRVLRVRSVSICTFVLVEQSKLRLSHVHSKQRPTGTAGAERQYLYPCTSKASKLSKLMALQLPSLVRCERELAEGLQIGVSICTFVLVYVLSY
jgi:hypothetical protein